MSGILAAPMLDQWSHHISHLYLISAFVIQGGQSLIEVMHSSFDSSNIFSILEVDKERNLHKIDSKKAAEVFYYDCSDEVKAWATTQLQHQPLSPLTTAIDWTDSGSQKENRTYIICEEDKTIPPSVQREMLKNYPCREISLECGHVPFLSHTEKLAEILGSHWVKKPKHKPKKDESKANSVNLDFLNDYLKY
jgi:pimeloyl-ACP methyl ester carboxylesterase